MVGRTERLRSQLGEDLERLVTGCASGDPIAWRPLLEAVRELAIDLARGTYHLGPEDAEDVAQLAQLRVLERLPQLRRPRAFPLWARRLVHHAALDALRSRKRSGLSLDALPAPEAQIVGAREVSDPYDLALLRADLGRALARLPALYREPIQLHLLEGIPQDEVGRRLGRPRSTVATQIERGLSRLRRTLSSFSVANR
ncbi:MAG: RNA polymerase sigma factor [Armatimonadetes bacterium]|nr:RNA polymerase sigma factor [Armatimonadota bacterium]